MKLQTGDQVDWPDPAVPAPAIRLIYPLAPEQRREITAAMHDAKDLNAVIVKVIDNEVIADGEAARAAAQFVAGTAYLRVAGRALEPNL